jgi:tRNA dimethylallyltransferase
MNNTTNRPFMLIIYGPTGVGKTELALTIAQKIPAEIINMDVGQFYEPLSIGTAKPEWKKSPIPHHLFDIISTPLNYTVNEYRAAVYTTVEEVRARGNLPILVGGSGFYLHALLFSQQAAGEDKDFSHFYAEETDLWKKLNAIDPQRAIHIDKNDKYRIQRALNIWHTTGKLPSSFAPVYNPQADYLLLFVERDRQELKNRINQRVKEMFEQGWIQETESLLNTSWQQFIQKKNLIGYREIVDYLAGEKDEKAFLSMIEIISAQTRQYAKRQFTFWRKLEREIKKEKQYTGMSIGCLETVNLTNTTIDLYSNELLKLSFTLRCTAHGDPVKKNKIGKNNE